MKTLLALLAAAVVLGFSCAPARAAGAEDALSGPAGRDRDDSLHRRHVARRRRRSRGGALHGLLREAGAGDWREAMPLYRKKPIKWDVPSSIADGRVITPSGRSMSGQRRARLRRRPVADKLPRGVHLQSQTRYAYEIRLKLAPGSGGTPLEKTLRATTRVEPVIPTTAIASRSPAATRTPSPRLSRRRSRVTSSPTQRRLCWPVHHFRKRQPRKSHRRHRGRRRRGCDYRQGAREARRRALPAGERLSRPCRFACVRGRHGGREHRARTAIRQGRFRQDAGGRDAAFGYSDNSLQDYPYGARHPRHRRRVLHSRQ